MKARVSNVALLLLLANCANSDAGGPAGARAVVQRIGARFPLRAPPEKSGQPALSLPAPRFASPWNASFEVAPDGALVMKAREEAAPAPRSARLAARLAPTADGPMEVEVVGQPGTWLKERLSGGTPSARAEPADGRVVYARAKRGVDRLYEVSSQRLEEYLLLADERAAAELSYELETGPGIADLVVDGSGFGLIGVDAEGTPALKAPQPVGVDARGAPVLGRLVATRLGEHHFSVRLALVTESASFPVLLDPSWITTGSMALPRGYHTQTLLPNGKVLVTGSSNQLPQTELYDPATGTWNATGTMAFGRIYGSATLLANGKVLVAGGIAGSPTATAELYDPATGLWSNTGSMAVSRVDLTSTLLGNGKVLVVGNSSTAVELYNPATGTWSSTGSMITGRNAVKAVLLPNGKVLVAGGLGTPALTSAELYDPLAGTWSATGSLATGRWDNTGKLLPNGKVLVAGGFTGVALASAELYDPAAGTWSPTGSLLGVRYNHRSEVLTNGQILVVGGSDATGLLATAEVYDAASGTWSAAGSMATARYWADPTQLLNGKVLVASGIGSAGSLTSAELYPFELLAGPCTVSTDCVSGFCADNVCCNTACAGACDACNLAGTVGTCTVVPVNSVGSPSCTPYLCSGTPSCPTSCTADPQCAAGHSCDGSSCVPQKAAGLNCTRDTECLSGHCVDGVCCNTACADACDACNEGGSVGTCTTSPPGSPGSPSCAPYVCGGAATCPGNCSADAQCTADQYCDGSSCFPRKGPGAPCVLAPECLSSSCADGVCCNTACTGACDACNLPGSEGTCTDTAAGSAGSPSCAPYRCSGAAATCPSSCTLDAQCAVGQYCNGSGCVPVKAAGTTCAAANECAGGQCLDGGCCDGACTGEGARLAVGCACDGTSGPGAFTLLLLLLSSARRRRRARASGCRSPRSEADLPVGRWAQCPREDPVGRPFPTSPATP